jgi:hypothetical protein
MSEQDLLHAIARAKAEGMMSVCNGAELTDNGARYWLTMDGWDAEQSAMLLNAIDPMRLARWAQMSGGRLELGYPEQFDFVQSLIAVAFKAGALHSPLAKPRDVIAWAKAKGLQLPRQFLEWQPVGAEQATGSRAATNRRDARISAIVKTAQQLGYDLLCVPHGGKAAIERECVGNQAGEPCRFTADTFKSAWQAARKAGLIDVENAKIYRGR